MAYVQGEGTHQGLLVAINSLANQHGWRTMEQDDDVLVLCGRGRSDLDAIYVGIRAISGTGAYGAYSNLELYGMLSYKAGRELGYHPGSSTPVYVYCGSGTHHLVVNQQRIMAVLKVYAGGGKYIRQMVHLGFINPPASSNQYPYPLLIGGCGNIAELTPAYANESYNSMFWANSSGSGSLVKGKLVLPGGLWADVCTANPSSPGQHMVKMCGTNDSLRWQIKRFPDGAFLTEQAFFVDSYEPNIYGMVEGLRRISGDGININYGDQLITIDYQDWLVVPDVNRTGDDDFAIMLLS